MMKIVCDKVYDNFDFDKYNGENKGDDTEDNDDSKGNNADFGSNNIDGDN